jgi:hypothetical protein
MHPSLCSLGLFLPRSDAKEKRDFTKEVADMLSVNERVEVMSFHDQAFDKGDWDAFVAPRLECNIHLRRFPSLQKNRRGVHPCCSLGKSNDKVFQQTASGMDDPYPKLRHCFNLSRFGSNFYSITNIQLDAFLGCNCYSLNPVLVEQ